MVVGVTLSVGAIVRFSGDNGLLRHARQRQLEMKHRASVGLDEQVLFLLLEALDHDRDRVVADGYGGEFELSVVI